LGKRETPLLSRAGNGRKPMLTEAMDNPQQATLWSPVEIYIKLCKPLLMMERKEKKSKGAGEEVLFMRLEVNIR
jgi:hypothetical protein